MKTVKKLLLTFMLSIFGLVNISAFALASEKGSVDELLQYSINGKGGAYSPNLYNAMGGTVTDTVSEKGSDLFNEQVLAIIGYVIDVFIVIGIAMAFFGGYKIMTSDKEETLKEGIRLVIFGVIGILIMVSARFIAGSLVGDDGIIRAELAGVADDSRPNGVKLASQLYNKIMYPFIKLALYFVIGILFFMMLGKVVSYLTATDDSVKKKAGGVIIRCVIGILIVMGAKQLVEAVMGKQDKVLEESATWIDEQGNQILGFEKIPLISQVINWVMGLTMLIILVLIVIQGYKMFTKPDDPKTREGLKKTLLYVIIGVLVIGAAYAISTVLVINNVPITNTTA